MKTLYREKVNAYIGEELIRPLLPPRLHYGEVPQNRSKVIYDFDTIYYGSKYGQYGIGADKSWLGKRYLTYYRFGNIFTKVSEKDFTRLTINTTYEIPISIGLTNLTAELSTEEFADWSKDIGLSALEKLN